jgi:hypothetical protein
MLLTLTQAGKDALNAEHIEFTGLQIRILCYCYEPINPVALRTKINLNPIYAGILPRYFVAYLDALIHKHLLEVIENATETAASHAPNTFVGKKSGNAVVRRS